MELLLEIVMNHFTFVMVLYMGIFYIDTILDILGIWVTR